jgi:uncharacterized repeat protein (TIGR04076 family)
MRRGVFGAAMVVGLLLFIDSVQAQAPSRPGSWLDGPIANWNAPGMAIPTAPAPEFSPPSGLCAVQEQAPSASTAEERALEAAGWKRVSTEAQWWGAVLVSAQQSVDGMCRPMQFQWFVFVDGQLAGTVSPEPMSSRTDGVGYVEALRRHGLDMHYSRYAPSDALCCPSGEATVRFAIERTDAGPVLVPQQP